MTPFQEQITFFGLIIGLVLFLAIIRISISTHRTSKRLEETNELLREIAKRSP